VTWLSLTADVVAAKRAAILSQKLTDWRTAIAACTTVEELIAVVSAQNWE
jgi:hypothetical protein